MFGKHLERKSDFDNVSFLDENKCGKLIASPRFRFLEEMENGFCEIGMHKKKYLENTLRVLGLFVLQHSKIMLLKFLYDFWDKFVPRDKYAIMSVDTDRYNHHKYCELSRFTKTPSATTLL